MEIIGNCFKINNNINSNTTQNTTNEIKKNCNNNLPEGQTKESNINHKQGENMDSSQNSLNNNLQQKQNANIENNPLNKQGNNSSIGHSNGETPPQAGCDTKNDDKDNTTVYNINQGINNDITEITTTQENKSNNIQEYKN